MGKGTKKKTVWRTFSFENGYTSGTDADTTAITSTTTNTTTNTSNGITALHHHNHLKNGTENGHHDDGHDASHRLSMTNGKFIDSEVMNQSINGYTENGHRSYFKRPPAPPQPYTDKYPVRGNGIRKTTAYYLENGNKSDIHDIYENLTKQSQFRSNRSSKLPPSRHVSYKKWDSRNGNYNSNGTFSEYHRSFRKSHNHFAQTDHAATANVTAATATTTTTTTTTSNEFISHSDRHFHEMGLANNLRNTDDNDKCHEITNGGGPSTQQLHEQYVQHRSQQSNKFNEDEYTRISTPRSEVLFKKGYLMRDKKYVGPSNTISTAATSSNDSGSVSVVSNEETASYYSIQSMSPDNSTYINGNQSSDSASATYPNDGFEHDLSLIYSSGFYDNNGYFYVNPYIQNNFDQFNGPTILMPYGSAPTTKDIDAYDADAYPQTPLSPATGDGKSIDDEPINNFNSINSEEMSNSSLSENISINNDPDTPPNPLTPPPSPQSPNEKPITPLEMNNSSNESCPNENENENDIDNETQNGPKNIVADGETVIGGVSDENSDVLDTDAVVADNYSMPFFPPLIFVPPIPFVPDARSAHSRRGKFRRHLNNHFGRPKKNNRFSHFYNKVYIPSNWSEAPDEASPSNDTNADNAVEINSSDETFVNTVPTSTIEQCDKILQNSKLNLNVSEFIPQNKRMIFVPLPITPSPPAPLYFVPIPSTESTLNVNVPEFLPKNYKPLNQSSVGESDDNNNENNSSSNAEPASSMAINDNDIMTMTKTTTAVTNESTKNQQNETTNNHKNGFSDDRTCIDEAAFATAPANGGESVGQTMAIDTKLTNKQNGVTVSIMSDLLKNNSNNLNLDACSFNNENSHTNLKADLGSKKITNSISKKVYKSDNYCNDSDSNKGRILNNSNKGAKTRHAYPKTKETSQQDIHQRQQHQQPPTPQQKKLNAWESAPLHKMSPRNNADDQKVSDNAIGSADDASDMEKSIEKLGRTYAEMVVPVAKNTAATLQKVTPEKVDKKIVSDTPKSPKSPYRNKTIEKSTSSNGNRNNRSKFNPKEKKSRTIDANRIERPAKDVMEGSVEWFTIGAKGKKLVTPNGTTITEIAFENESNVEKVNKIAEELQLDINKDADLAMDIMDSLMITDAKTNDEKTVANATKKKKSASVSASKSKRKSKDKSIKEQKRCETFDIIEPNFAAPSANATTHIETNDDDDNGSGGGGGHDDATIQMNIEADTQKHIFDDSILSDQSLEDFVFDPNVFATPCNLQMDSIQRSASEKLGKSLRLSTGKIVRNLINQFDIYQPDYAYIENQQLKQEEEMVIKVLQQLNKTIDDKIDANKMDAITMLNVESMDRMPEIEAAKQKTMTTAVGAVDRENSVERFAINAKPYQNVYSSDHFLEHFFGDRNDKCDHVEPSTDLSSSDQHNVDESIVEHFDTYPAIGTDSEVDSSSENDIETLFKSDDEYSEPKSDHDVNRMPELQDNETIKLNDCGESMKIGSHEPQHENDNEVKVELEHENEDEQANKVETQKLTETEQAIMVEAKESSQIEANITEIQDEQKNDEVENEATGQIDVESVQQSSETVPENADETVALELISDEKPQNESENDSETFDPMANQASKETSTAPIEIELTESNKNEVKNDQNEVNDVIAPKISIEPVLEKIVDDANESKSISSVTETPSVEKESIALAPGNQSIKSTKLSNGRPWLRIVDTQMLQQEKKKLQQTFPITSAVSMWLNEQKEKTPEPVLRIPDYRLFATTVGTIASATGKRKKADSQTSHSNSSIDLTEDTASITSDKFHINDVDDDEEEDILNFWESPIMSSSSQQSPTPPPIYNSVYGTSINYTNLLSNKNELLCNNIVDYDAANGKLHETSSLPPSNEKQTSNGMKNGFNQNAAEMLTGKSGADEKCYRPPPEVCCTIM